MSQRVIYAACSIPAWVDIALTLEQENGWQPCYWIGRPRVESMLREYFPGAVFHAQDRAMDCTGAPECSSLELPPLDADFLEDMAYHEVMALHMMDRLFAFELGFQERRRIYYWHLRYWTAVLDRYQPDIYFNPSTPHQVYDYVLYVLCRRKGIKTILFSDPFNVNMLYAMDDFQEGSGKLQDLYQQRINQDIPENIELTKETEDRVKKLLGSGKQTRHIYISNLLQQDLKHPLFFVDLARHIPLYLKWAYRLMKGYFFDDKPQEAKLASRELNLLFYRDIVSRVWMKRLKRQYALLAQPVDLDRPYIYVTLHFQPELATSPEGGFYVDQYLMVHLLSEAVPEGWWIYVKEHPIQHTHLWGSNKSARSLDFYGDIAALSNVRLVPMSVSTYDLLDNAKAVASVTGTSCWEAVVRGKPAMVFGHAWYNGCEGVFHTTSYESCKGVVTAIKEGYTVDQRKVRLFLQAVEEVGCRGTLYEDNNLQKYSSKENKSVEGLVIEMTRVIQEFFSWRWPAGRDDLGSHLESK